MKAAEQGNSDGQFALGMCYYKGTGVEQDFTKAVHWLEKSAKQGNASAKKALGLIYENKSSALSRVLPRETLARIYEESAELGIAAAQYRTAEIYHKGKNGKAKDITKAIYWYEKAAAQGHEGAKKNLATLKK